MPIVKENGITSVVFGAGDVGLALVEAANSPIMFVAVSQMNRSFEIGGDTKPGVNDVFANQPELVLGFFNLKGIDNVIEILQQIRGSIALREARIRSEKEDLSDET